MNRRFILYSVCILLLLSCNLLRLDIQNDQRTTTRHPETSIVPKVEASPVPVLTGEEVPCTYFVSPDGDDRAPGSFSQPWGSFQFAMDSAEPGSTVCFREGMYVVEDTVQINNSGTAVAPITYAAHPGEHPILDGGGAVGDLLLLAKGASHLRISGFTLRNFNAWGLSLDGENQYIHMDHLTIEGGEAGMHFTYGDDDLAPPEGGPVEHITVENSVIVDSEYTGVDCTPGPCNYMSFHGIEVYGSGLAGEASFGADGLAISRGYPVLVEDCYIHDNGGDGIDLNSRDLEGYVEGVIVRRNRVIRNNQNGIKLWAGGLVENNILWGQGNSALWLGTFHSQLEVVNNTIAFNMWDQAFSDRNWAFSVGYPEDIVALPKVDLVLVNNIFAYNTGPDVGDPTGIYLGPGVNITEHHNLYFSREDGEITAEYLDTEFSRQELQDGTWSDRTGQGLNDLVEEPLFQSGWPQVELRLQPASPGIDAGDQNACPDEDILGNPRPVDGNQDGNAACDLGAFEWNPGGKPTIDDATVPDPTSAMGEESSAQPLTGTAYPETEKTSLPKIDQVMHWLYLIDVNLDDETIQEIVDSTYDMVVLDYIVSEEFNSDFPIADIIDSMHRADHSKLVIAYIDIGQAEDFRTYWQPDWGIGNPEWIIALDPDGWEGNYPVAYWWDEFREIWLGEDGYLQGILDAGFDGVYLDWIEAYSDENVVAFAKTEGVDPLREMIWWVGDIAAFTRAQDPDFIVIAQNAAELAQFNEYVDIIDAISQEQVWFDGGADNIPPGDCPLPETENDVDTDEYYESLSPECQQQFDEYPESTLHVSSEEYIAQLTAAQAKGLPIFTVDYATVPGNINSVYRTSRALGFVPFVSNRFLDQFVEPKP